MAVTAVVFDLGETLIDESGAWERAAGAAGVPRFALMGVVGGLAARGRHHAEAWQLLGAPPAAWSPTPEELYPDALPCLQRLREGGYLVAAAGNVPAEVEELLRAHVDFVGSSESWGVKKPAAGFFERVAAECARPVDEIAYVGDRVDNDVRPALGAGMVGVHVRRGPWGHLHDPPPEAVGIRSLDELPEALHG
jgi:FMN phosphatase YigB (HAD superfamily)